MYLLIIFSVLALASSEMCKVNEYKPNNWQKQPEYIVINCQNVDPNLIIREFYFTNRPYPQDVKIESSSIPTVSNYTSLLNMQYVRKLDLSDLGIKTILPGAFRNMKALEELDLSNNELVEISEGAFAGLSNLKKLNLRENKFNGKQPGVFKDLGALQQLDIVGNPVPVLNRLGLKDHVSIRRH